jgi:hypothetical protein
MGSVLLVPDLYSSDRTGNSSGMGVAPAFWKRKAREREVIRPGSDTDGDGLINEIERMLGSDWRNLDSDGDGYWDAEEVARHSSPVDYGDVPSAGPMSIQVATHAYDEQIHAYLVMYFPDGVLTGKVLEFGRYMRGTMAPYRVNPWNATSTHIYPSYTYGALVVVLELVVNPISLHSARSMSIYATLAGPNGIVVAASSVNLVSVQGRILQFDISNHLRTGRAGGPISVGDTGTAFFTYLSGGEPPGDWVSGSSCVQMVATVGVEGAVVTQEVEEAACESGFDGSCSPGGCAATVGTTIQTIDPLALIGT